jgi:hypothetical protein
MLTTQRKIQRSKEMKEVRMIAKERKQGRKKK